MDGACMHAELLTCVADVHPEQAEVAVVLDACEVEVGEIATVVDDPLRVRIREADARLCAELERGFLLQLRITSSTSSRLRSIRSGESASRFKRSRGSVLDGRTFMCQSSASTERPSRWETLPSVPKRSLSSA